MTASPRARARLLFRSGRAQPGIFAPLVLAQAAEIEALPLQDFLGDPTKLAKGLTALHQALQTDAVVTTAADGLLAEAAGAELDWSTYPAVVAQRPGTLPAAPAGPRLDAAVEATARLAATAPGDPVLVAALTGPATLADSVGVDREDLEPVGAFILEALKRFLEAGTNLVVIVEAALPQADVRDAWRSALAPLANVTRFHQAAPVLVLESAAGGDHAQVPPTVGLCADAEMTIPGPPPRVRGVALAPEPKEWPDPLPAAPLLVTAGAVPGVCGFAEVLAACAARRAER